MVNGNRFVQDECCGTECPICFEEDQTRLIALVHTEYTDGVPSRQRIHCICKSCFDRLPSPKKCPRCQLTSFEKFPVNCTQWRQRIRRNPGALRSKTEKQLTVADIRHVDLVNFAAAHSNTSVLRNHPRFVQAFVERVQEGIQQRIGLCRLSKGARSTFRQCLKLAEVVPNIENVPLPPPVPRVGLAESERLHRLNLSFTHAQIHMDVTLPLRLQNKEVILLHNGPQSAVMTEQDFYPRGVPFEECKFEDGSYEQKADICASTLYEEENHGYWVPQDYRFRRWWEKQWPVSTIQYQRSTGKHLIYVMSDINYCLNAPTFARVLYNDLFQGYRRLDNSHWWFYGEGIDVICVPDGIPILRDICTALDVDYNDVRTFTRPDWEHDEWEFYRMGDDIRTLFYPSMTFIQQGRAVPRR